VVLSFIGCGPADRGGKVQTLALPSHVIAQRVKQRFAFTRQA
jgi:hypothetical protein